MSTDFPHIHNYEYRFPSLVALATIQKISTNTKTADNEEPVFWTYKCLFHLKITDPRITKEIC